MKYEIKTAVGVVLNDQGQILLGRCKTDDDRNGFLCFPGGGIDGDEDIFSAAIREVKEETNIVTSLEHMIFSVHNTKNFVAYVVLKDTGANDIVKFNDEYDEANPGGWYSLDSLPTEEVFNLNLDVMQNLGLINSKNVEYKINNESIKTIKELVESGASAKEILELKESLLADLNYEIGKEYRYRPDAKKAWEKNPEEMVKKMSKLLKENPKKIKEELIFLFK